MKKILKILNKPQYITVEEYKKDIKNILTILNGLIANDSQHSQSELALANSYKKLKEKISTTPTDTMDSYA